MPDRNLSMLTDFYEITMMQGYFSTNTMNRKVVFDLFYRNNPSGNGYSIAAGLEQAISYIKNLKFTQEDIEYLERQNCLTADFLDTLRGFSFSGDIDAIPEGTVVFPNEPLLRITTRIFEAQLIETALLNIVNHQSLIATKAARVTFAARGDRVLEMGLRRAQGPDSGLYGTRAAIIGGCHGTSNVLAGRLFDIPIRGTQAHSWIMSFPDELAAFRAYALIFPNACTLLVDTYDTLRSGVPNAIRVFQEMKESLEAKGETFQNYGIRLDSGDLAYLSKEARSLLDAAGFEDAVISASSDLDEHLIADLKSQGAKISLWGVGTNLITSRDCPAFGGVYKLAAEENECGEIVPKIKLSENPAKVTNPGIKKVVRFYDRKTGKIKADLITLDQETVEEDRDIEIFDPVATWKRMTLKAGTFRTKELLVPVFSQGKCVYESPTVAEIREYARRELDTLWDEHKRLVNPHELPVDLSQKLWDLKQSMIREIRGE